VNDAQKYELKPLLLAIARKSTESLKEK